MIGLKHELQNRLSKAVFYGDNLFVLQKEWSIEKQKREEFCYLFLQQFGDRLGLIRDNTPEWNLYVRKCREWEVYDSMLRAVRYHIDKRRETKEAVPQL